MMQVEFCVLWKKYPSIAHPDFVTDIKTSAEFDYISCKDSTK